MFRINARQSVSATVKYYTEEACLDYYSEGQHLLGIWGGKGAERLGLAGKMTPEAFVDLCNNRLPGTDQHLTPRDNPNRTVGYDMNYHCPKSVSLIHAWNDDRRIVEAFHKAVRDTMTELEVNIRARVRKHGQKDGDEITGNIVYAEFIHLTTRPVNGEPDPHMHGHCFVFNATYHEQEFSWKAGQFREIVRNAPYYQAAFMARLAANLQAAGYPIRRVEKAFEIVGVPESLNRKFSRRKEFIEETARKLGITEAEAKDKLGAMTREKKIHDISVSQLKENWWKRLTPEEREILQAFQRLPQATLRHALGQTPALVPQAVKITVKPSSPAAPGQPRPRLSGAMGLTKYAPVPRPVKRREVSYGSAEMAAIEKSIQHCFDRKSVVTENELAEHALHFGVGEVTPESIWMAMPNHPDLIFGEIDGRRYVSSQRVLAEEKASVRWVRDGKDKFEPFGVYTPAADCRLDAEQQAAMAHIMGSRDRVIAIEGKSGTGKTWLMVDAVANLKALHIPVVVMAPNSLTVSETLHKGGLTDAITVEKFLRNESIQEEYRGGVLWADEAGQLSSKSMLRLFDVAERYNIRIIFSGDTGQHRAVERGDALRMLFEYADLKPAVLKNIRRQTGTYKQVIEHLSVGNIPEAFKILDEMGAIIEGPEKTLHKQMAQRYIKALQSGDRPGVISPTHSEGRKVTDEIRTAMRKEGLLGEAHTFQTLRPIDMSEAYRADWRTYRPGWILELNLKTDGTPKGTRLEVVSIDDKDGKVYVKKPDGSIRDWNLEAYVDKFSVYEKQELTLYVGDRVRITKNGKQEYGDKYVTNGSIYSFRGLDEHGDLRFDKDVKLRSDYAHFDLGYVITSFGSQGMTVNLVLIAESPESFAAASREQAYVALSRAKIKPELYTANKEGLLEAVQVSSQRPSALDLVRSTRRKETLVNDWMEELRAAQTRAEADAPKQAEAIRLREQLGTRKVVAGPATKSELVLPREDVRLRMELGEHKQVPNLKVTVQKERPEPEREEPDDIYQMLPRL